MKNAFRRRANLEFIFASIIIGGALLAGYLALSGIVGLGFVIMAHFRTKNEMSRRDALEIQVHQANRKMRHLFESNLMGVVFWRKGGKVLDANQTFCDLLSYTPEEVRGGALHWLNLTSESDKDKIRELGSGQPFEIELYSKTKRLVPVLVGAVQDEGDESGVAFVLSRSERKAAEVAILEHTRALEESNRALEEFAHVASHDLQEPLRMVSSYVQLIASRYQGKLDKDGEEFIKFAVDGAKRMQALIIDLLAYARLQRKQDTRQSVSAAEVLKDVIKGLQLAIDESEAVITHDELPVISGNRTQLTQLFQNLLTNSIKFRRAEAPRIHITAERDQEKWRFTLHDNGIGFSDQYAEKIFGVFQRLHILAIIKSIEGFWLTVVHLPARGLAQWSR